jgi:hypothetical protein
VEHGVAQYIVCPQNIKDKQGRPIVIRNRHLPECSILTGIGPIPVKQPRILNKRGQKESVSALSCQDTWAALLFLIISSQWNT